MLSVDFPLVSVVIPSYNHARFLPDAIESIQQQTYPSIEIIVVDDGSTDETRLVVAKYPQVKYVYQTNQGLSAARNTGVKHSTGKFVLFSDADDLLYDHAVAFNLPYLQKNRDVAFVSGGYDLVDLVANEVKAIQKEVLSDHYLHFLKENYIGMHGTVLYQRWVFDEFQFDTDLAACEDYDMFLKVTRKYPVLHHTEVIASYRIHTNNMSNNAALMLAQSCRVLKRQEPSLTSVAEKAALRAGLRGWVQDYCYLSYFQLRTGAVKAGSETDILKILRKHKPKLYCRYLIANCYDKITAKNRSRV